jgi:DNA-binding NarL/FixJ family response regulator
VGATISHRHFLVQIDIRSMKLMIVDDHAGTREMIRNFLDLPGITVCECASGDEAVRRAREFKPDWVTMDVQMPGRNGFQSTEALLAECPSAQVVIITSFIEPHFHQLSNSVGATALIYKENLMALHFLLANEMNHSNQIPTTTEKPASIAS